MQGGRSRKTSSLSILTTTGVEPYQEKPGEEYMNKAQLAYSHRILEAWRNQLRDEVDCTVIHMQDEATNLPDPVDRAAQEEEFSLELRNRDRERKLIKKIEKALKRVENEDFGCCESCGVKIGIRHLKACPAVDLCIDYETLTEIREKQTVGQLQPFHHVYHKRETLPPCFLLKEMTDTQHIGRFTPSPSGELHFGSLIAALGSCLQAHTRRGRWLVHVEDIDPLREVPGTTETILRQLEYYGLHRDDGVLRQSQHHHAYRETLAWLHEQGLSYHYTCTRAHIQSIDGIYDGHCRVLHHGPDDAAVRIHQQHPVMRFTDQLRGTIHVDEKLTQEDFIVHHRDGLFAYNLAVVADDRFQGITEIVHGANLIEPTVRQISLYQLFGWKVPDYIHLPLALNLQGTKLSEQNHALALPKGDPRLVLVAALQFLG